MNDYSAEVHPTVVELVVREAGSTGHGNVLARFKVPVLLCYDDTGEGEGEWKVDGEAMKDDFMNQLKSWVLAETRPPHERPE